MDNVGSVIEFFFFARANRGKSLRVFLRRENWTTEEELLPTLLIEPYGVLYVESRVAGDEDPGYIKLNDIMYYTLPVRVTDAEEVRHLPRLRTLPLID